MLPSIPVVSPEQNDLADLAHSQLIQALLVDLLTNYPQWCPRYDDFRRRYANALCIARQDRAITHDLFTSQLTELTGNQQLSKSAKLLHVKVWRVARQGHPPIGGSPREWLDIMAGFMEICFPRTPVEWLNLAEQAYAENETRECIQLITAMVVQSLNYSAEAGYVALDIEAVQRENPKLAFAVCMTWLAKYVALSEVAWPTLSEVNDFAILNKLSAYESNESQRTNLAIMLLFHNVYQGLRDQRASRENPFAFVVRKKLASPLRTSVLHPEINAVGELTGLRQLESGRLRRSQSQNGHTADEHSPRETAQNPTGKKGKSHVRKATVTDRDRETVRTEIAEHKSKFHGQTPSTVALRAALKGKNVGQQKLKVILDEFREEGTYDIPGRT